MCRVVVVFVAGVGVGVGVCGVGVDGLVDARVNVGCARVIVVLCTVGAELVIFLGRPLHLPEGPGVGKRSGAIVVARLSFSLSKKTIQSQ